MKCVKLNDLEVTTTTHNAGKKRQMISNGAIPHLAQFAQVSFAPGEIATEHKHEDMYEIFFIESGSGTIKLNGEVHPLEQGMCITVEPGELHEVTNTGGKELVLTYFGIIK